MCWLSLSIHRYVFASLWDPLAARCGPSTFGARDLPLSPPFVPKAVPGPPWGSLSWPSWNYVLNHYLLLDCYVVKTVAGLGLLHLHTRLSMYLVPDYSTYLLYTQHYWVFWCQKKEHSPNLSMNFFSSNFFFSFRRKMDPITLSVVCIK